jgi:hypothetical protein
MLQERAEKQQNFSPSSVLGGTSLPIQEGAEPAATSPIPAATGAANEGAALPIVPPAEEKK